MNEKITSKTSINLISSNKSRYKTITILLLIMIILSSNNVYAGFNINYLSENNETTNLNKYDNNVLLVDGMATWCKPCQDEMEQLVKVFIYFKNDNVKLVSLSLDPNYDTIQKINDFKKTFNGQWEFGIDIQSQFANTYGFNDNFPSLYLFNKAGELITIWEGPTNSSVIIDKVNQVLETDQNQGFIREVGLFFTQNLGLILFTSIVIAIYIFYEIYRKIENRKKVI